MVRSDYPATKAVSVPVYTNAVIPAHDRNGHPDGNGVKYDYYLSNALDESAEELAGVIAGYVYHSTFTLLPQSSSRA